MVLTKAPHESMGRRNPHRKAAPDVQILLTGQNNIFILKLQLCRLFSSKYLKFVNQQFGGVDL
jgi:hypothetical protein